MAHFTPVQVWIIFSVQWLSWNFCYLDRIFGRKKKTQCALVSQNRLICRINKTLLALLGFSELPSILLCFFTLSFHLMMMLFIFSNYVCSLLSLKVLCRRGGLTLKTQHLLNHELMSSMKEYLTQGWWINKLKLTFNLQHSRKYFPFPAPENYNPPPLPPRPLWNLRYEILSCICESLSRF